MACEHGHRDIARVLLEDGKAISDPEDLASRHKCALRANYIMHLTLYVNLFTVTGKSDPSSLGLRKRSSRDRPNAIGGVSCGSKFSKQCKFSSNFILVLAYITPARHFPSIRLEEQLYSSPMDMRRFLAC